MAKPKVTATDRLSNVLDVVELGRRTGMLSVERGAGPVLEEGEVYFVSGSPIYARLGPLRGSDALGALARWGECRFSFETDSPQPIPNVDGVLPAVNHGAPAGFGYMSPGPNAGFDAGYGRPEPGMPPQGFPGADPWSAPPNGYPSGGLGFGGGYGAPPDGFGAPGTTPGMAPGMANPDVASGPGWGLGPGSGGLGAPGTTPGMGGLGSGGLGSGGLGPATGPGFGGTSPFGGSNPTVDPIAQARLKLRPRRAPDVRDLINVVTTYNLSRAHRTMLLLADGEHSILDLARLSGKPVDEVLQLLRDLEGRNLVFYA